MASDQTFQFISDPKHTETLSGRVSAACAPCRMRKTKCSGFPKCKQCEEKGVSCEAPPPRKRAKHEAAAAASAKSIKQPDSESPQSEEKPLPPKLRRDITSFKIPPAIVGTNEPLASPPLPHKPPSTAATDFAYTGQQLPHVQTRDTAATAEEHLNLTMRSGICLSTELPNSARPGFFDRSPSTTNSSESSFSTIDGLSHQFEASNLTSAATQPHPMSMPLPQPTLQETSYASAPFGQSTNTTFPSDHQVSVAATSLIHTANLLEEEARFLRHLASQLPSVGSAGQAGLPAQQTVSPAFAEAQAKKGFGLTSPSASYKAGLESAAVFLRPDGSLRSGWTPNELTPGTGGFPTFWDSTPPETSFASYR